jgi:hypothetical protein
MKTLLWLSALLIAISIGYNLGLRAGLAKGQAEISNYRTLYYQAIQWQATTPVTHITKASGLKEKE